MTIPEAIEILKAAEDGKVIEYKITQDGPEHWVRIFEPKCEMIIRRLAAGYELRSRSEPREWWALIYGQSCVQGALYATKEEARRCNPKLEAIRVREVIDP